MSFVVLCLAACGKDSGRAFLDTRTPPSLGPRFWAPDGWAWGTIEVKGAPEIRYGVSGPLLERTDRHMIIATGYGESAEVYFETARDLSARGWTVWVIEPHGQGGSGRFPGERDVGRSAGFDKDATAIRALLEQVIRPSQDDTVVLAGHGSGALSALLAIQGGLRRVDRLFLWEPDFTPSPKAAGAANYTNTGLGFLRAEGAAWKRPTGSITSRAALPRAWPVANPDLRLGGPAWSWIAAEKKAIDSATAPGALRRTTLPVAVMAARSNTAAWKACAALAACVGTASGAGPGHLAADPARAAWFEALTR